MTNLNQNKDGLPVSVAMPKAVVVSTYVPRQCGLATFAKDLHDAIAGHLGKRRTQVIAMDDVPQGYSYPDEVHHQISQQSREDYLTAAELLNINHTDVVFLQHEFGIFGGDDGVHVLDFVRDLRMPIISTLHTVLKSPSTGQRAVLREVCRESDRVVVMSQMARDLLIQIYGVAERKIAVIPHGIPDVPFYDSSFFADQFGCTGRTTLLTFGLLSPGKGIGTAIRAMPKIVEQFPNVLYIVLGATHPHVLRDEGNAYRDHLQQMVKDLNLQNHVRFDDRFVGVEELIGYIGAADIYITPYPNEQQITSGTLAYAVGAGKAVVSTPYWHAKELLADGRGRLFPFNDSEALASQVIDLLSNPADRQRMRKRAYLHGRPMVWSEVGRGYVALAQEVLNERHSRPRPIAPTRVPTLDVASIPEINVAHLYRLTDDTGILQHATFATPNRHHGYCVDDNARALVAGLMYYDLTKDETVLSKVDTYLAFMHYALNPGNNRFRNFMSYDRKWIEDAGSEDSHGRSIWAIGTAAQLAPNDSILALATQLFHESLPVVESLSAPRAWAFSLLGIHQFVKRFSGDTRAKRMRRLLGERLMRLFRESQSHDWPWLEDVATYDNAKLPHALLLAGHGSDDAGMFDQGLASLEWLVKKQTLVDGRVSLIGNDHWMTRQGHRAIFDQQPIEAMAMVEACAEAYRLTLDIKWFERSKQFLGWFLGNNDTRTRLYDVQTGGCRDGLVPSGANLNQGAESTLAWLISTLTLMDIESLRKKELRHQNDEGLLENV